MLPDLEQDSPWTQSWLMMAHVHGDVLNPDRSVINSKVGWAGNTNPQIRFTNHGSHYFNKKKIMALINHISLPNGDAGGGDRITCDREEHKLVSIEEWRGVGTFWWMFNGIVYISRVSLTWAGDDVCAIRTCGNCWFYPFKFTYVSINV